MGRANRHPQTAKHVLVGFFVIICLGALFFYWAVAPEINYHILYPTLAGIMLSYLVLWAMIFMVTNGSQIEKMIQFFLSTGSLILTIGFIELLVAAQVADFRSILGTPISEPWRNPGNLHDPTLLHIHKPHDRWLWDGIEYRYDQHGFRNETDLESADLIVVGDSFVEGWNVSADNLLTSHLARQLDRPVANLGQSWYGPQQELEVLQRYGLELDPKVCVWVFFEGNDLYDMHRYKKATQDWNMYSKEFHSFRERSLTKNSILAFGRYLHSWQNQGVSRTEHRKGPYGIFRTLSGQESRMYFQYKGLYLSDHDRSVIPELRLILKQAHNLCQTVGAKFLFVFAPIKFRVYKDLTEFDTESQARYWVANDLPQKLRVMFLEDFADEEFLDLTPAFVEQAKQKLFLYFDYDTHWSPEGHRVVASAIANVLKKLE